MKKILLILFSVCFVHLAVGQTQLNLPKNITKSGNRPQVVPGGRTCPGIISSTSHTDAKCPKMNDGSITILPAGLQYRIGTKNPNTFQPGNTFSNLTPGSYHIQVWDGGICYAGTTEVVGVQSTVTESLSKTDESCIGKKDGTITATGSGGTPPYEFKLGTAGTYGINNVFTNLKPATYRIFVKDAMGCGNTSVPVTILAATDSCPSIAKSGNAPQVVPGGRTCLGMISGKSHTDATCAKMNDGSITILPAGLRYRIGTMNPNTFQASNIFSNLTPGSYHIQVWDVGICYEGTREVVGVQSTVTVSLSKTNESCIGKKDGTITATGSGGTPPYQFKTGIRILLYPDNMFTNLKPGTYKISATDANGCGGSSSVTILAATDSCSHIIAKKTKLSLQTSDKQFDATLYPNPTGTQFTLRVHGVNNQPVTVRVTDANGRGVYATKGFAEQPFKFGETFSPGIYMVEVRQGREVKTLKVIKLK